MTLDYVFVKETAGVHTAWIATEETVVNKPSISFF
jgi:hypothetical protein